MYLAASSGGGYIATRTNSMISIETNSVERMNFSNGGNVRIRGETALTGTTGGANGLDIHTGGGTSIPIYFGSEQHSAQKSLYLNGYWMYYRGHVNEGHKMIFSQSSGNAPHGNEYVFKYNSALRPGSSNTWDGWSDQRAKQNVQTITNGIAKIKQLRPITYDWTDEYADSTGMYAMDKSDPKEYNWFAKKENGYDTDAKNGQYGFIAQEYETVLPKDVKLNKFKLGDTELTDFRRKHVGFVFQFYNLIPSLTAKENVELITEISDDPMSPVEALEMVGLSHRLNHFPSQLSGGEMQRIAIARALVNEPEIILADELTGSLDQTTAKNVFKILYKLRNSTRLIIYACLLYTSDAADE